MYIFCFLRTGEASSADIERAAESLVSVLCSGVHDSSESGLDGRFITTAEAAWTVVVGDAARAATFA